VVTRLAGEGNRPDLFGEIPTMGHLNLTLEVASVLVL